MNKEIEAVCKKHGFDFQLIENGMLITKPKDIWEGVEFALAIKSVPNEFTEGLIYLIRCKENDYGQLGVVRDDKGDKNGMDHINFKPSTESAYIEQLKKEAHGRFGEIKEGVVIDNSMINLDYPKESKIYGNNFYYEKEEDRLLVGSKDIRTCIYKQGKWATQVKERVKVDFVWSEKKILGQKMPVVAFHDKTKYESKEIIVESVFKDKCNTEIAEAFRFLASQLEKYLNNEL